MTVNRIDFFWDGAWYIRLYDEDGTSCREPFDLDRFGEDDASELADALRANFPEAEITNLT